MSHRLIIRATAEADITDAAIWYNARQQGLGHRFVVEVQTAVEFHAGLVTPKVLLASISWETVKLEQ